MKMHQLLEEKYKLRLSKRESYENIFINLHEALDLSYDEESDTIVIYSTLEGKDGKNETYRGRKAIANAGFSWDAASKTWWSDSTNMPAAKKLLTTLNKTEYIVGKLEDLKKWLAKPDGKDTALGEKGNKQDLDKQIDGYIKKLADATDVDAASEEVRKYLEFFAKGWYTYSFWNTMLILIQMPDATRVANYSMWKGKGRQVRKGESGIVIRKRFDPSKYYDKKSETWRTKPNWDPDKPIKKGFKDGYVFDISQTEAIEGAEPIPEQPEWFTESEPSATADALHDLVTIAARMEGIEVSQKDAKGKEKGYSANKHINITSNIEGAARVSTMVHEYAHELMHWKDGKYYVGDKAANNTKTAELQAESVSFAVMSHYAIPCKHHSTYLALWQGSGSDVNTNMETIRKVTRHIIEAIEKAQKDVDKALSRNS
jgi:hypothetical protein